MAKLNLTSITSQYMSTEALDANFQAIAAEFNDKVLYRDNPVGEPNTLHTDVDANSKRILNLPDPVEDGEPVPKGWFDDRVGDAPAQALLAQQYAEEAQQFAEAAEQSASEAEISAEAADVSADLCEQYSSLGLAAGSNFNFGLITDTFIAFPSDFGSVV